MGSEVPAPGSGATGSTVWLAGSVALLPVGSPRISDRTHVFFTTELPEKLLQIHCLRLVESAGVDPSDASPRATTICDCC